MSTPQPMTPQPMTPQQAPPMASQMSPQAQQQPMQPQPQQPQQQLPQQQLQRIPSVKSLPTVFSAANNFVKTRNMRILLSRLDDRFVMYDIAMKLKFTYIASKLKETIPGLKHFVS